MTTIVATHVPGRGSVIASDTQITQGYLSNYYPKGKIVTHNGWAIGVAGLLKTLLLIERHGEELLDKIEDAAEIADRIAAMTKEYGYTFANEESSAPVQESTMIVASADGVWRIDACLATIPGGAGELLAIGSGAELALGVSFATQAMRNPVERVSLALQAAMRYDTGTGGDIVLAELRNRKKLR